MKKAFRFVATWTFLTITGLSMTIVSCGGNDEEHTAAKLLSTEPAPGATVAKGTTIRLTFDKNPGLLAATGGIPGGSGATRTVTADAPILVLSWDHGGEAVLNFTLASPALTLFPPDKHAPQILKSSPRDGQGDVDPDSLIDRGIVLTFDESIGETNLDVSDERARLGWITSVAGATVTVKSAKGKGMQAESPVEFVLSGQVADLAGNKSDVQVSFSVRMRW